MYCKCKTLFDLMSFCVQFYDAWKDLCDWLDESSKTVTRFMVPVNQGSATKQNIDDLKVNLGTTPLTILLISEITQASGTHTKCIYMYVYAYLYFYDLFVAVL